MMEILRKYLVFFGFGLLWSLYGCVDIELGRIQNEVERGKQQYEMIKENMAAPRFGPCWTSAINNLNSGCIGLDEDSQSELALAFANCFLQKSGEQTYECENFGGTIKCTPPMSDRAYNVYMEWYTHTQSMCYFLKSQVWNEQTQRTITELSSESSTVAMQLNESNKLQRTIIEKQKESLSNVMTYTENVQNLASEFQSKTRQQQMMLSEVFDKVGKLQSLVLGEFTTFYTVFYYLFSVTIIYLITSAPRTSSARFWLFALVSCNAAFERAIVKQAVDQDPHQLDGNINDIVYENINVSRQATLAVGVIILTVCALRYKDLNVVNNQLLQSIQRQIKQQQEDFMSFVHRGQLSQVPNGSLGAPFRPSLLNDSVDSVDSLALAAIDEDEELSDTSSDSYSSKQSDESYRPPSVVGRLPVRPSSQASVSCGQRTRVGSGTPSTSTTSTVVLPPPATTHLSPPTTSRVGQTSASVTSSSTSRRKSRSSTPITPTRTYNLRSRRTSDVSSTSSRPVGRPGGAESPDTFALEVRKALQRSQRHGARVRQLMVPAAHTLVSDESD